MQLHEVFSSSGGCSAHELGPHHSFFHLASSIRGVTNLVSEGCRTRHAFTIVQQVCKIAMVGKQGGNGAGNIATMDSAPSSTACNPGCGD